MNAEHGVPPADEPCLPAGMSSANIANQLQFGAERIKHSDRYNINCINFTPQEFGLTNHEISAQQKAMDVISNSWATF